MNDARTSGSTHDRRSACQVRVGNGREGSIFLVANMDELDLAVSTKGVDDRIESIPHNSVAAFDARACEHFPQQISNLSSHTTSFFPDRKSVDRIARRETLRDALLSMKLERIANI